MKRLIMICLVPWLCTLQLQAQPGPDPGRRPYERIERWKKVRMIEFLDLSEEQSARFFARLNEHEKKRRTFQEEETEALDRLERLLRNRASESEYPEAFSAVLEAREKVGAEERAFFQGLDDLLSVEQRAKFLLFQRQFELQLRDAFREMRRGHLEGDRSPEGAFPDF
jgi:hypothetical protein